MQLKTAIVLAGAFFAAQANAAPVTVEYTMPIVGLMLEDYAYGESEFSNVQYSDVSGFTIAIGDTITARLTYDDATPLNSYGYTANFGLTLTYSGGHTLAYTDYAMMSVYAGDGTSEPRVTVSGAAWPSVPADGRVSGSTANADFRGTHHQPGVLPSAGDWQYLTGLISPYNVTFRNGERNEYKDLYIEIGAMVPHVVSAVPEPAAASMVLAGLAVIGALGIGRRQRNRA